MPIAHPVRPADCVYVVRESGAAVVRARPFPSLRKGRRELLRIREDAAASPNGVLVAGFISDRGGGRGIVVAALRSFSTVDQPTDLWLVSHSGRSRRLTTDGGGYGDVAFSPDGTMVAYTSREGENGTLEDPDVDLRRAVYVQDLRTLVRRRLYVERKPRAGELEPRSRIAWVPDGRGIVYSSTHPRSFWYLGTKGAKSRLGDDAPDLVLGDRRLMIRYDAKRRDMVVQRLPSDAASWRRRRTWNLAKEAMRWHVPDYLSNLRCSPDGAWLMGKPYPIETRRGGASASVLRLFSLRDGSTRSIVAPDPRALYDFETRSSIRYRESRPASPFVWKVASLPAAQTKETRSRERPSNLAWRVLARLDEPKAEVLYP